MSAFTYMICDESDEITEVVIHSVGVSKPRIDPQVLAAFLLYHTLAHPGTHMRLGGIDSSDKSVFESVEERRDCGNKFDWVEWNADNYMTLLGRNVEAMEGFKAWSDDQASS